MPYEVKWFSYISNKHYVFSLVPSDTRHIIAHKKRNKSYRIV